MDGTAAEIRLTGTDGGPHCRFRLQLATRADDAALRQLLRETPMEGAVRITLRREPSYFDAATVEGTRHQVLLVRGGNRVVGMGSRSVLARYIEGQPTPVGYLSGLRLQPEVRSATLLARGYRLLRQLHADRATSCYLTTIAAGNTRALAALTSARAGLPNYFPLGDYYTFVLPLRSTQCPPEGVIIRPMTADDMPAFLEFLRQHGPRRPFFPVYTAADFSGPSHRLRGLSLDRMLTAWRGAQLIGTLGAWNQGEYRQTVVEGYSSTLRRLRPALNAWAKLRGWPRFPAVGTPFRYLTGALPLVSAGQTSVLTALLSAVAAHFQEPSLDAILIGMSQHDAMCETVRRLALFRYVTRVFLVFWDDEVAHPERFANREVYLELGCL